MQEKNINTNNDIKEDAMETTRAYKFRVYPDAKRHREIDERLILAQQFYNKLLEESINSYKNGNHVSMAQFNRFVKEIIAQDKNYLRLYSQTRCEIEYRLMKAYQSFFRRVKSKKEGKKVKVGFPRFKSRDKYKSITYPQDNGSFSIHKGRLRVSRIGNMPIEMYRSIEGKIKTMTIKREGKEYYAIFTAIHETTPPKIEDTNPIGIDLGLNNFIALSDGTTIQKPKFVNQRRKRIAIWQNRISRRAKGSKRRQFAKEKLQKEWINTTNQSNDFAHKLSDKLINSGYTSFAVETLGIQNMVKNHRLAQSIYNASWNRFIQYLSYKAESAGMRVIKLSKKDTAYTTQECHRCHNIKEGEEKLTLENNPDRIYHCNKCELQMDRDINASINILNRGRVGYARTNAQGDIDQYASTGNASRIEELRTDKTHPLQDAVFA